MFVMEVLFVSEAPFVIACPRLVLASASPRRRELLRGEGLAPEVVDPESGGFFHEPSPCPGEKPEAYVLRAAIAKAGAVAARMPDAAVIGADTIVVLPDGNGSGKPVILGKPRDENAALDMLRRLAGRRHLVITGCCVLGPYAGPSMLSCAHSAARQQSGAGTPVFQGKTRPGATDIAFADTAEVLFGDWPDAVLKAYASSGEPLDKAGAYAIQGMGSFLVEAVHGSWSTVVGLPVPRLLRALLQRGIIKARAQSTG